MSAPIKLTPELRQAICALIRQGAYPHVAAESQGVPREVFQGWLARGQRRRARRQYREFAAEVRTAKQIARALAESIVYRKDPKCWLRSGPGRELPNQPGWSTTAPPHAPDDQATSLLTDPRWNEALAMLLDILKDYPEAREAVARQLLEGEGENA